MPRQTFGKINDFNHHFAPPELLSEDAQDTSVLGTAFLHEQAEVQSVKDQLSEDQKCIPNNWWFCHLHKSKFSDCPLYLKLSPDSRKTVLIQYYGLIPNTRYASMQIVGQPIMLTFLEL